MYDLIITIVLIAAATVWLGVVTAVLKFIWKTSDGDDE